MEKTQSTEFVPFPAEKKTQLNDLITDLEPGQIYWLHGFMEGLLKRDNLSPPGSNRLSPEDSQSVQSGHAKDELTVLYGGHTGNSRKIANQLSKIGQSAGINIKLVDMNDYRPQQLRDEKRLLLIVSTHGEGDPPIAAEDFYEYIHSKRAPKLENLQYSVLALGDKSYINFCKTGADIDKRFQELGATPITPRIDCDVEFQDRAQKWIENNLNIIERSIGNKPSIISTAFTQTAEINLDTQATRSNPAETEIAEIINLNGKGSSKETYHIELLTDPARLPFQPGDSLAVFPDNDPNLVHLLLKKLKLKADTRVKFDESTQSLEDFLLHKAEISMLTRDTLERYNDIVQAEKLTAALSDPDKLKSYLWGRDLLDLTSEFPLKISAEQLVQVVRKLQPRSYSIASSPLMYPDEIHLTVGLVEYKNKKRKRRGACSSFLGKRIQEGDPVRGFIERNEGFHLPEDTSTDLIMIGPGTGIAPFRAFMQEREMNESKGKNWLFYGDRNFTTDFLYQTEWQKWYKNGLINRIDLAFSRDQTEKIYVQHRLLENSKDVFDWIENGSRIYVCGDGKNMAKDVQKALIQILRKEANLSPEKAEEYLKTLKKQKRYLEDVY